MAKKSRDKGNRREREFAALIGGKRVPLSGMGHEAAADEFSGDVIGPDGRRWEVKARADGFKQLYKWLKGKDALALKADGKPWLIVMPLPVFHRSIEDAEDCAAADIALEEAKDVGTVPLEEIERRLGIKGSK